MGRPRKRRREADHDQGPSRVDVNETSNTLRPDVTGATSTLDEIDWCELDGPLASEQYEDFGGTDQDLQTTPDFPSSQSLVESQALEHTSLHNVFDDSSGEAATCSCLPTMYLATSKMTTDSVKGFPAGLVPIREAMQTAADMLVCSRCSNSLDTFRQNFLLLNTLLQAVITRFRGLFHEIDAEYDRVRSAGQRKAFRIGDSSPGLMHLHTGRPDCPLGFTIELEPVEWQSLAYRVVKSNIYQQDDGRQTVESLVSGVESRQISWHGSSALNSGEHSCHDHAQAARQGDFTCLRLMKELRRMIGTLPR